MRTYYTPLLVGLILGSNLSGCSPSQNWRDLTFEGSALKAQLPCKPDRAKRPVPLGGVTIELQVAGCESGTAMVAVMTAHMHTGADANAVLAGWQKATLDNARVLQPLPAEQRQVWHRPGLLPLDSSSRIQAKGMRADGQTVSLEAVWGAMAEGDRVRLVHAVVYDRQIQPDMANTLFDGLKP